MGRGKRQGKQSPITTSVAAKPTIFYPSDLTWLYNDCPRCFYLKLNHGIKTPRMGMPAIFRTIDDAIRRYCMEIKRTEAVCPDMPPGEFILGEHWVNTTTYSPMPGHHLRFGFSGKPDTVVRWDDGSYGVLDFKTTSPKPSTVSFYAAQVEMYSRALEQPRNPKETPPLSPISLNGILAWEPLSFNGNSAESIDDRFGKAKDITLGSGLDLRGRLVWLPVEREKVDLKGILEPVITLLEAKTPPDADPECSSCKYYAARARMDQASSSSPA